MNLKEIRTELRTQDNRMTDQPMFIVMQKVEYPTSEEYSYDRSYWMDSDGDELGETLADVKKHLIEFRNYTAQEIDDMKSHEFEMLIEKENIRQIFVFEIDDFVQAFITAKSAEEYIETNKHRLYKPFFYATGTYRNYEMQSIRNLLLQKSDKCQFCQQKMPSLHRYNLSKKLVYFLASLHKSVQEGGEKYFKTELVYGMSHKGSNTAYLTQLKYFGAVKPYFEDADKEKVSKRSGKWEITESAELFLKENGYLPEYVEVYNGLVKNIGNLINIHDKSLKWQTEDDIWEVLKSGTSS
mgnify:CR=1 FL=1